MWKSLRHPNVLPLIGVTMTEIHFSMVSEWMVNGNIKEFMKAHPDEDRLKLVGFHSRFHCCPFRFVDGLMVSLAERCR